MFDSALCKKIKFDSKTRWGRRKINDNDHRINRKRATDLMCACSRCWLIKLLTLIINFIYASRHPRPNLNSLLRRMPVVLVIFRSSVYVFGRTTFGLVVAVGGGDDVRANHLWWWPMAFVPVMLLMLMLLQPLLLPMMMVVMVVVDVVDGWSFRGVLLLLLTTPGRPVSFSAPE